MREFYLRYLENILSSNNSLNKISNYTNNKIINYLECVHNWDKTHNLVSAKYSKENLVENAFDSLIGGVLLDIKNQVYDVGTGGGFPGILLAIIYEEIDFILVESCRKKCSFLRLVKNTLNLSNIIIENKRVENLPNLSFVVTKAAFSPSNIATLASSLAFDAKLAIWATSKNTKSFIEALAPQNIILSQIFEYELLNQQQRRILLFSKSSGTIVPRGTKLHQN